MELVTDGRELPEPATVLRTGNVDAAALVVLWLTRRSFWTLAWVGIIVVALNGDLDDIEDLEGFDATGIESAADARDAVRSPQALLVLTPVVRLGSGWLALALAYPLARRLQRHADRETGRGNWHPAVWSDRWYITAPRGSGSSEPAWVTVWVLRCGGGCPEPAWVTVSAPRRAAAWVGVLGTGVGDGCGARVWVGGPGTGVGDGFDAAACCGVGRGARNRRG